MATIKTLAAGVSPYPAAAAEPTVLVTTANGRPSTVAAASAVGTGTTVIVNGQAALNNLITTNQSGVFEGANVTINLEEQNFNTTNQVTATTNYPAGNTGEIQYNSGANSFASDAYFTYVNSNVVTPGIRTNNYLYANGSPFTAGGNAAIGNFVFTGDVMTISDANQVMSITGNGTGNIRLTSNSNIWTFNNVGNLTLPSNTSSINYANGSPYGGGNYSNSNVSGFLAAFGSNVVSTTGNITAATINANLYTAPGNVTVTANTGNTWTFATSGNLVFPTGMIIENQSPNTRILTNTGRLRITATNNAYVQIGWQSNIAGTGPVAKIYANGIDTGQPSNVVIKTGNLSATTYDWVFGNTGNLAAPGRISATNIVTNSIASDDSSFVTIEDGVNVNGEISATGNITGNYFIGNGSQLTGVAANTGNVTFSGEIVIGTGTSNLISGLYLAPSSSSANANMYLRVRGNIVDEPTHIHFDTGNNAYYNQFIGDDNKYIQLANTGNIVINSNDGVGNSAQWTFGSNSKITLPNGASLNDTSGDSVAFGQNAGLTSQAQHAVAIGINAGRLYQGEDSVAIGYNAGYYDQQRGVAIGWDAGEGGILFKSVSDAQGGSGPVHNYVSGNGNPTLTLDSVTNVNVNDKVFGNNIPSGAFVASIADPAINISAPPTAALTAGDDITFVSLTLGLNNATNVVVGMRATGTDIPANTFVQNTGCSVVEFNQYPTAPLIDNASIVFTVGQGFGATAIGYQAGSSFQDDNAVAVGRQAGYNTQGANAVAVGGLAGYNTQNINAVAVGYKAGYSTQGARAVAIGEDAGFQVQGEGAVAIGFDAGGNAQGILSVAIGTLAGNNSQGNAAVAVGYNTGITAQGLGAVAIGTGAGRTSQGDHAVAIGDAAGYDTQGVNSVVIGSQAGESATGNNSIIINATGNTLNQTTANTFTVAPVRNDVANIANIMFYNATSKEITYGNVISVAGNITGGNVLFGAGIVSGTGNITGGNLLTGGLISATGNITVGNLNVTGNIVDTGALTIITGSNGNIALAPNGTGNVTTGANVSVTGNITGGNLSITGNITGNTGGFAIGYLNVPQVSFAGNATIAATDAGKHYYSTLSTSNVLTIANNTSVSWAVGTAISLVNRGTGNITVAQGTGVSLYLAGNITSGNRTVATYGMATLLNVAANIWMINGTGVT